MQGTLRFTVETSPFLVTVLILLHLFSSYAVYLIDVTHLIHCLMWFVMLCSLIRCLHNLVSLTTVVLNDDGGCTVEYVSGKIRQFDLKASQYTGRWLTLLALTEVHTDAVLYICLMKGSVDAVTLSEIKCRIKLQQ